jgi:hypothetical protein
MFEPNEGLVGRKGCWGLDQEGQYMVLWQAMATSRAKGIRERARKKYIYNNNNGQVYLFPSTPFSFSFYVLSF